MPILEYLSGLPPRERSALGMVLEREETLAAEASVPNEGAEACVQGLVRKGYRLGILTRNSLRSVRIAFQRFRGVNLTDFSAVITREGSLPKPHPDGVRRAAETMGLLPAELLVVGDFRFDIMAGHAAGAITALLVHVGENPMRAGDPEPDYVIGSLQKIHDILKPGIVSHKDLP
jgi:HAD superfamily hydrolase (TIGR01509 family)